MASERPKSQTILVVGGGIAGITAAVEAAEVGCDVVLVERDPSIGGRVAQLNRYFPKLCHPTCGLEINFQRIRKNPRIKLMTMTAVTGVTGTKGDYVVTLTTTPRYVNANCTACGECARAAETEVPDPFNFGIGRVKAAYLPHEMAFPMRYVIDGSVIGTSEAEKIKAACKYDAVELDQQPTTFTVNAGAIIWATGWRPYDAAKITPYGYDRSPDVINNMEMERLAARTGPTGGRIVRPSNGEPAKRVALIQCAGSRDQNHLPYCSGICCLGSLKHAAYVREQYADAQVDIYYIDIRTPGKFEAFYNRIRSDSQVRFIKSKPGHIETDDTGTPVVCGEDTISREVYARPYDLVVLATGMEPVAAGKGAPEVALERDEYGFIVPGTGEEDGMFQAGVAAAPLDVALSVQTATAAALRAVQAVTGG
ncbi:MAG: CoB--CoM heterodisulfide reductase iron-sulfur subunit A family protein [Kiloniellales bacterium]